MIIMKKSGPVICGCGLRYGIWDRSSWLTTYFLFFNISVYQGSLVLSFYWVFMVSGLFLTQKMIKKTNEITIILYGSILGAISILIFGLVDFVPIKLIFLAMNGFFISGISPMTMSISISQNPNRAGSITGFIIAFYLFGEILFQPLLGFFAEHLGKNSIIYIIIAGFIITMILSFLLFMTLRVKNKTRLIISSGFRKK
jgi:MFS family permease